MPNEENIDQIEFIDVLSTAISGYGFLLITLKGTSWNLYFPFTPSTQIASGFLLFLLGCCVIFSRSGVSRNRRKRRKR